MCRCRHWRQRRALREPVAAFLTRNAAFSIDPISPAELYGQAQWIEPSGCLRTFPYELKLDSAEWSGMDGFFAARLVRGS